MTGAAPAKLVMIIAEGLDWAMFGALVAGGACPGLAALAARPLNAAAHVGPGGAASLLSGVHPEVHGLWHETEAWAGGERPLTRASWRVAPLWQRLADAGIATASVALPGSIPGASWAGTHFDSRLADPGAVDPADWALPLAVAPPLAREAIRDRRIHPADITAAQLAGLVSDLAAVDQSRDHRLAELAVLLARAGTVQAAARWLLAEGGAEALLVRHDWTAALRQRFGGNPPPFASVLPAAWRLLDAMVRDLAALAPGAALLFVSPGWDGRPGVLAASPDFAAPAGAIDVCAVAPLVLAHFGLAWQPPAPLPPRPDDDAALLAEAIAGGGTPLPPRPPAIEAERLALLAVLVARRDPAAAIPVAEAALAADPDNVRALRMLATTLAQTGRTGELDAVAARLRAVAPDRPWGALAAAAARIAEGDLAAARRWLAEAEGETDPETAAIAARLRVAAGQKSGARNQLDAVLAVDPGNLAARLGLASAAITARDFAAAEAWLAQLAQADAGNAAVHIEYARLYLATGRPARARDAIAAAAALGGDPETLARLAASDFGAADS